MTHRLLAAAAAFALALPAAAEEPPPTPLSPGEIVDAAPAADWVAIAPSDLLVMDLAPDAAGKARRVVIQLMPAPFSQGWIGNIRKLAAAHWWDGTSINRVQDNYVVQWGDATEKKALPNGLVTVRESEYEAPLDKYLQAALHTKMKSEEAGLLAAFRQSGDKKVQAVKWAIPRDPFAEETLVFRGWPIAVDRQEQSAWPVHCYGMVGVGRNLSPDTGSGAELYTVIGHAPRHLDRNIALVGRVVAGIEHLSSLPRGTGALGFYEEEAQRVPIASVRIASELPAAAQPRFEYLSTASASFAKYADARANRRDPFFIRPAGGADICNIPVPVRPVGTK
ncbi:peptidylprolyl isomerase [Sphingopyxis alaskensis]|uniref:peptidylprolyl isomerase n=1 Tax=Sphingopyxis alaskensis TaxID=117207 RepID=UPI00391C31AB